ncbi:hypothetical protein BDY21DRAFT_334491 [Lineolata rhizophorae]|uniref:Uncharacterized protein n=1 Tax=Lineolata rhizophorae TaxID=578093 RepID=A0A6A6PBN3_9PEZI|nr:hypothetical protein BDY21DRAFT_334491 [Lineolata rhizophorae]
MCLVACRCRSCQPDLSSASRSWAWLGGRAVECRGVGKEKVGVSGHRMAAYRAVGSLRRAKERRPTACTVHTRRTCMGQPGPHCPSAV